MSTSPRYKNLLAEFRRRPGAVAVTAGVGGLACGALLVALAQPVPQQVVAAGSPPIETTGAATPAKPDREMLAKAEPAAKPADGSSAQAADCDQQAWPHITPQCLTEREAGPRKVRVISTDKLAAPVVRAIEAPVARETDTSLAKIETPSETVATPAAKDRNSDGIGKVVAAAAPVAPATPAAFESAPKAVEPIAAAPANPPPTPVPLAVASAPTAPVSAELHTTEQRAHKLLPPPTEQRAHKLLPPPTEQRVHKLLPPPDAPAPAAAAVATAVAAPAVPAVEPRPQQAMAADTVHASKSARDKRKRDARSRRSPGWDNRDDSDDPRSSRVVERWTEREYEVPSYDGAQRRRVIVIRRGGDRFEPPMPMSSARAYSRSVFQY